ncbi:hypothetical protein JTB14_010046 [Gonioctena quinquepunctata]|nr:hypothetical protein JTB14_010046 [Gonioctena quinquepunctata]
METNLIDYREVKKTPDTRSDNVANSPTITSENITNNKPTNNNKKILQASNYHGRNLASYLSLQNKQLSIESIIKTNASVDEIINTAVKNTKLFTKDDLLLIWLYEHENNIEKTVQFANKMAHTDTIIITAPYT